MKDGMKTGITERPGGVWKSSNAGFPMKGSGIRFADSDDRGFPLNRKTGRGLEIQQCWISGEGAGILSKSGGFRKSWILKTGGSPLNRKTGGSPLNRKTGRG